MSFDEIAVMTMYEYQLRLEAYQLKKADEMQRMAVLAMFNREAKAQKKSGKGFKYVHTSPDEIFNLENATEKIRSAFEPNYKSSKENQNEILLERMRKWRKLERG